MLRDAPPGWPSPAGNRRAKSGTPIKSTQTSSVMTSPEYRRFIKDLKSRVLSARLSAARAVNRELILLYWDIGRAIVEKQRVLDWGESVVEMVASDLRRAFPRMRGFSTRNVWDMRRLYQAYTDPELLAQAAREIASGKFVQILRQPVAELATHPKPVNYREKPPKPRTGPQEISASDIARILPQLVAEIPWGHNLLVLNKVTDPVARLFYLRSIARYGWTRNVLLNQIKASAYERSATGQKTHNFAVALPEQLAAQADEMLKTSYNLEFLGLRRAVTERNLEDRLISRLQAFLLELGYGFCFVGRQYRLSLGQKEYFIDLLFYHRHLRALVAFDLKLGAFEPEHAGKMDFYLNLLNDTERAPDDRPSVGIILCAEKDDVEVEYALRTKQNPIGVAVYELQSKLPAELKGKLPTAKQLAEVVRAELPERSAE